MMFKLNPRIRWRKEGPDKILLNNFMSMNMIGKEIMELFRTPQSEESIGQEMHRKFPGIPLERICADVQDFVTNLKKLKILVPAEQNIESLLYSSSPWELISASFNNRLSAPVEVVFEITRTCNSRCPHCSASATRNVDAMELSTNEWKKVIDEMSDLHVFNVTITGGEPLLRSDIEEIIKYASKKDLYVTLSTNGYLLTEEGIDTLHAEGVGTFMISLDAANAKAHDEFRGLPGSFDRAFRAISVLIARGIPVIVLTVITRKSIVHVPALVDLLESINAPFLALMRLVKSGYAVINENLEPSIDEYLRLLSELVEKEKGLTKLRIEFPNLPANYYVKSMGKERYAKLLRTARIERGEAGIVVCAISPTGDVKPCDMPGNVNVGNVRKTSLKEIWDGSSLFNYLRSPGKSPCCSCSLNDLCVVRYKSLPFMQKIGASYFDSDPIVKLCYTNFGENEGI